MQQQQEVEHHHLNHQPPGVVPIHNDQEGDRLGRQGGQEPHHRPHAYEVPEGLSPGKTMSCCLFIWKTLPKEHRRDYFRQNRVSIPF